MLIRLSFLLHSFTSHFFFGKKHSKLLTPENLQIIRVLSMAPSKESNIVLVFDLGYDKGDSLFDLVYLKQAYIIQHVLVEGN